MALVPCFKPLSASCAIQQCCALQTALEKARLAFVEVLDGYTLSDLVQRRASLPRLAVHDTTPRASVRRRAIVQAGERGQAPPDCLNS